MKKKTLTLTELNKREMVPDDFMEIIQLKSVPVRSHSSGAFDDDDDLFLSHGEAKAEFEERKRMNI
jgi:hypothetical protein